MPPMDYIQFKKLLTKNGYSIGHSTRHHTVLNGSGQIVGRFAVAHKSGGKDYIKDHYVKTIRASLGI